MTFYIKILTNVENYIFIIAKKIDAEKNKKHIAKKTDLLSKNKHL